MTTSELDSPTAPSRGARVFSAALYGLVSLAIMLINKQVLTLQRFPSPLFLGLGQMIATILLLKGLQKTTSLIHLPPLSRETLIKIFPLPLFYMANMLFGLLVTQELSLPMITVLRRFSILFTLLLQIYFLQIRPDVPTSASVGLMMLGALLAAAHDLSFSLPGYTFITLNNISTALSGVFTKRKLTTQGPYALAYLNSFIMLGPMSVLCFVHGDFQAVLAFSGWTDPGFVLQFLISCVLGCLLIYSSNFCTQMNSPLDTNIIGCLKNILVTYIGMVFGGDYIFSLMNFVGINISILGSLVYTYISFFNSRKKKLQQQHQTSKLNQSSRSSSTAPLLSDIHHSGVDSENSQNKV